ncbi:unnamed protein product [marine sediment metagenome]|uniref:Uncharacterized protein n=1 Tax=marine sediment metagenome TaxID=412755 RepID=X1MV91_9ZZZZ
MSAPLFLTLKKELEKRIREMRVLEEEAKKQRERLIGRLEGPEKLNKIKNSDD